MESTSNTNKLLEKVYGCATQPLLLRDLTKHQKRTLVFLIFVAHLGLLLPMFLVWAAEQDLWATLVQRIQHGALLTITIALLTGVIVQFAERSLQAYPHARLTDALRGAAIGPILILLFTVSIAAIAPFAGSPDLPWSGHPPEFRPRFDIVQMIFWVLGVIAYIYLFAKLTAIEQYDNTASNSDAQRQTLSSGAANATSDKDGMTL